MLKNRVSKLKRKKTHPIRLTARDGLILRALHKYRYLTTDHIQTLTQTESRWGMNKRLRLLYDHKYVDRPKAQKAIFSHADKRPTIYALGNKGASLLSNRYNIPIPSSVYWTEKNRRVREKHIEHTLGISDFMVGIEAMCKAAPHLYLIDQDEILSRSPVQTRRAKYPFRWQTQITYNGEHHNIAIVPDYVFGIRDGDKEKFYFVEIDRGTMPISRKNMTQSSFMRKVLSYSDTFERGLALNRFDMRGFQILTVTTSQERIQNIQDVIADMPETSFSANTFLFKVKGDHQGRLPFHAGWQNWKGYFVSTLFDESFPKYFD